MYICLCNALTDMQIRDAVRDGAHRPRDVYAASDCRAQCGGCTRTILGIIRENTAATTLAPATIAGSR
jgi:bacterioferritin-associated ferredoxin